MATTFDIRMFDAINQVALFESAGYDGVRKHQHTFYELVYILSGTGINALGDEETALGPGDVFFMGTGQVHSLRPTCPEADFRWINCIFEPHCVQADCGVFGAQAVLHHNGDPRIRTLMMEMLKEYREKGPFSQEIIKGYLQTFLYVFRRNLESRVPPSRREQSALQYREYIFKAAEFINANYQKPVRLQDIADYVGISASHLDRVFHQGAHPNPIDALNIHRVEQSCRLLMETDWPISRVAREVGINDVKFYYTLFKRRMMMPPGEFRRKNRIRAGGDTRPAATQEVIDEED